MTNNKEMFCNHCKRETLFFLESDLLWYCDECGHAADSLPEEEDDWSEWFEEEDLEEAVHCASCHHWLEIDTLVDGYLCPICFEDLSDELEKLGYDIEGEE